MMATTTALYIFSLVAGGMLIITPLMVYICTYAATIAYFRVSLNLNKFIKLKQGRKTPDQY